MHRTSKLEKLYRRKALSSAVAVRDSDSDPVGVDDFVVVAVSGEVSTLTEGFFVQK